MTTFLVGYDLSRPGADYDGLIKHLKGYGTYWHGLDSTWLIVTSKTADEVRDGAAAYLDSNDKLLVTAVHAPGAWRGFAANMSDWLKSHLK